MLEDLGAGLGSRAACRILKGRCQSLTPSGTNRGVGIRDRPIVRDEDQPSSLAPCGAEGFIDFGKTDGGEIGLGPCTITSCGEDNLPVDVINDRVRKCRAGLRNRRSSEAASGGAELFVELRLAKAPLKRAAQLDRAGLEGPAPIAAARLKLHLGEANGGEMVVNCRLPTQEGRVRPGRETGQTAVQHLAAEIFKEMCVAPPAGVDPSLDRSGDGDGDGGRRCPMNEKKRFRATLRPDLR